MKKAILKSVSFDRRKFRNELEQSVKKLNRKDRDSFIKWVRNEFGAKYPNIISTISNKMQRQIIL